MKTKKDQWPAEPVRDFVAKVSTTADHEIIRHCLRGGGMKTKKDQWPAEPVRDFVAKAPLIRITPVIR